MLMPWKKGQHLTWLSTVALFMFWAMNSPALLFFSDMPCNTMSASPTVLCSVIALATYKVSCCMIGAASYTRAGETSILTCKSLKCIFAAIRTQNKLNF